MQETSYKIYLYPRWFIRNAARPLLLTLACTLATAVITHTEFRLGFFFLSIAFAGLTMVKLIPLASMRKPCMICSAAGMMVHLQLQPEQRNDKRYFRTLHEFISWEHLHGIYLIQGRHWYKKRSFGILRINYSVVRNNTPAFNHIDILVNQLDVHPESMYNTLMAYYSKYKPVNH